MRAVGLFVALGVASGCTFDGSGVSDSSPPPDPAVDGSPPPVADARPSSSPDAPSPDASPDCVDEDGDGYVVAAAGPYCGGALDCDDSDPRVHPAQNAFFAVPRNRGGFDYDCDGRESPIDGQLGASCYTDWFDCEGTGWLGEVPSCGEEGTYHICEFDFLSCEESSVHTTEMSCR